MLGEFTGHSLPKPSLKGRAAAHLAQLHLKGDVCWVRGHGGKLCLVLGAWLPLALIVLGLIKVYPLGKVYWGLREVYTLGCTNEMIFYEYFFIIMYLS